MCLVTLYLSVSPQGHNIFSNLSSTEYSDLMQLLKQSILATDLTLYFEYVALNTTPLIKALDLHRGGRLTSALITYLQWRACPRANTAPLWIVHAWRLPYVVFARVQEQEPVLRAGQQRRVQLECEGSQGHVQVEPRTFKKKENFFFWRSPIKWEITWIYASPTQVHDDDGVRSRCCH